MKTAILISWAGIVFCTLNWAHAQPGCVTPPSGLIAWWRAETNGLDSAGANNATLVGGVGAPVLFGFLIASPSRNHVGMGYLLGALLMLAGAICEHFIGVEAAGKSLESIADPLSS